MPENKYGTIYKIAEPIVMAQSMAGAEMFELVRIGCDKLVGEIIKLEADTASIQCYGDTSGLTVGDPVLRTGSPLSVTLGPGIMETIYDGIQRPLNGTTFIPRGVDVPALDCNKFWEFEPKNIGEGSLISGGDIFGMVFENGLFDNHRLLIPPRAQGRVTFIAPPGQYNINEKVIELEFNGERKSYSMCHQWPVRIPRPAVEKLQGNVPLLTGQRVLDALFPSCRGGTCAIPSLGLEKTRMWQALSKYSNSDCTIYMGCEERDNEMAEALIDFSSWITIFKGKTESVMKKTCLVSNTPNMPVAAIEASIYTGITLAEYFRDMGCNAIMMADFTSRWAEALREISGRLAEMHADAEYPANLGAKLAQFYERAGRVTCLGSPAREGSVSIVGTVNPPDGDFTDPVATATLNIVQAFWGLDKKLVKIKHLPCVNWSISFSNYERQLESYFDQFDSEFSMLRTKLKEILQEEESLQEIVKLVGKDSLSEDQKTTLAIAKVIRKDFLHQNAYSKVDYTSPLNKTVGMMRAIITFHDLAKKVIRESPQENKISWAVIEVYLKNLLVKIYNMKNSVDPKDTEENVQRFFISLIDEISAEFRILEDAYA